MTYTERIKEFKETYEATGSLYQAGLLIPEVVDDEYFSRMEPVQKFYECKKYERKTQISELELEKRLTELAKANVQKTPILSYFKRKTSFIEEHKDAVKKELQAELEKQEDEQELIFNKHEQNLAETKNQEYKKIYDKELEEFENIFNPSQEWLNENFKKYHDRLIDKWGGVFLASGASVIVQKTTNGSNKYSCSILVDNLTEFSESHPYKYSITAAGNLSQRVKSDKQIEEEYAQNICAEAFINAICLFNVCLDAKEVLVTCYLNHIDSSTGNEEIRYLYSVIVPRELVKSFKMENLNAVAALMSLEGNADIRKDREIYFVEPLEWNLSTETSQNENQKGEIDIDFRKLNINLSIPEQCNQFYENISALPNLNSAKEICKQKVLELEIFTDEFDADNYANGFYNFLTVIAMLKQNENLFQSENYEQLKEAFEQFFGNSSYAMNEIQKLIDADIFARIIGDEENIPLSPIVSIMLKTILKDGKE